MSDQVINFLKRSLPHGTSNLESVKGVLLWLSNWQHGMVSLNNTRNLTQRYPLFGVMVYRSPTNHTAGATQYIIVQPLNTL